MLYEEPRIRICDGCQSRDPVYLRVTDTRRGPETRTLVEQFCPACFAGAAKEEELFAGRRIQQALLDGHCKHCGAPPRHASGYVNFMEGTTPGWAAELEQLWCGECYDLLREFLGTPEGRIELTRSTWQASQRAGELHEKLAQFIQERRALKSGSGLEHQVRLNRTSYQFRLFRSSGSGMLWCVYDAPYST